MFEAAKDDFSAARLVTEILQGFDADAQSRILRWAAEKVGQRDDPVPARRTKGGPAAGPGRAGAYEEFLATYAPVSDTRFAAAVAYALQRYAPDGFRKDVVAGVDVREAATRIGRQGPNFPGQTLINAERVGLLRKVGYGRYTLTAQGIEAVENATSVAADGLPAEAKVPAKFRNPKNQSQTWSGHGMQPVWLRDALRGGARLEKFRIE
jgi:DNA-binding protein H-NS